MSVMKRIASFSCTRVCIRHVYFATRQVLRVHLEEMNTTENIADGSPSTLLASIEVGCHCFEDIHTVRVEHAE